MAGTDFDVSNLSGFVKAEYNDANIVAYLGNNMTVTIRSSNWIEFNDLNQYEFHNNLCNDDTVRRNLVIDYANLIDKLGTTTAVEYVELLISSGTLDAQYGSGGGGGGDASASNQLLQIAEAEETNTLLTGIDAKVSTEAKQDTANATLTSILAEIGSSAFDGQITFPKVFTDISGALHTESATTQIDLKQTKDDLPLFFSRISSGTATQVHSTANAETVLSVSANADYAIAQTKERFNYLTGKTKRIILTATNFDNVASTVKRVGYFNGGLVAPYSTFDGVYLESDGTTHNVCVAKAGTVTKVARALWDDPFNGTGPSGLTIDFANFLIIRIEFLWLGGGSIRFQIETNDEVYNLHTINNGNDISGTYIKSPNQPVRYEIRSTGGSSSLNQICSTVGNSGGNDLLGTERGYLNFENVLLSSTANDYLVYSTRLKQTHLDVTVSILDYDTILTTNDNFLYFVLLNPTFSSTPTYNAITNSAVEIATGNGTITVSSGTVLRSGVGNQKTVISVSQSNVLRLGSTIAGVADEIAYVIRPLTSNARAYVAENWIENN